MLSEFDYIEKKAGTLVDTNAGTAWRTTQLGALVPYDYNNILLGYTANNLTSVTYVNNGSNVAVLNLSYNSGSQLTSVTRV